MKPIPTLSGELSNQVLELFQGDFNSPLSPSTPPPTDKLSLAEEVYGLSLFWSTAKTAFALWHQRKLDWDGLYRRYLDMLLESGPMEIEAYYNHLQSFAAALGDGHTYVRFPNQIREQWSYPNIQLDPVMTDQQVTWVVSGGALPKGTIILAIDERPIADVVEQVSSRISASTPHDLAYKIGDALLRRPTGQSLSLHVKLPGGQTQTWTGSAQRRDTIKNLRVHRLDNGIVHIVLPHFQTALVSDEFQHAFPDFRGVEGVVLDIRDNPGGNTRFGYDVLGRFLASPTAAEQVRVPVNAPILKSWGMADRFWLAPHEQYGLFPNTDLPAFTGPVTLLTSPRTYSAAEDFTIAFKSAERGIICGQPTGGSTGQSVYFELPGGGLGQVLGAWDLDHQGREFVGVGITPDVTVVPTLTDYTNDKDPVLDSAIEWLLGQKNPN